MLYITFKQPENFNRDVDVYFNNRYEDEWLEDPVVKQIVRDIDHSEILSNRAVESPVLGIIPLTRISGGDSGVGKTSLIQLVADYNLNPDAVNCDGDTNIRVLISKNDLTEHGLIFFLDEN